MSAGIFAGVCLGEHLLRMVTCSGETSDSSAAESLSSAIDQVLRSLCRSSLEYNDPKHIWTDDLELRLYDALDIVTDEDLLATIKVEDLVLSGNDYIFIRLFLRCRRPLCRIWQYRRGS